MYFRYVVFGFYKQFKFYTMENYGLSRENEVRQNAVLQVLPKNTSVIGDFTEYVDVTNRNNPEAKIPEPEKSKHFIEAANTEIGRASCRERV